jgi:hypothetical protein
MPDIRRLGAVVFVVAGCEGFSRDVLLEPDPSDTPAEDTSEVPERIGPTAGAEPVLEDDPSVGPTSAEPWLEGYEAIYPNVPCSEEFPVFVDGTVGYPTLDTILAVDDDAEATLAPGSVITIFARAPRTRNWRANRGFRPSKGAACSRCPRTRGRGSFAAPCTQTWTGRSDFVSRSRNYRNY